MFSNQEYSVIRSVLQKNHSGNNVEDRLEGKDNEFANIPFYFSFGSTGV
jgi:hypothetical protein